MVNIPAYIKAWFKAKNWQIRPYQRDMVEAFQKGESRLLIAPTGGGKTLSGFLASLIDIHENKYKGLHTLYISPLKALTNDIERNLMRPVMEMGLDVRVESRTGDTSSSRRVSQRKRPPNILLTTPESLMLMLSYHDAKDIFKNLRAVIIDEVHSFAPTKRGDFTSLCLARLRYIVPNYLVFALSATVAEPQKFASWLGPAVGIIEAKNETQPEIIVMKTENPIPFTGYMAKYAIPEIYKAISEAGTSIIFVNTRSQAEKIFQDLWEINENNLPIAIYHGSISRETRQKTEKMMADGKLRSVVATAALELGIDWGQVDLVIQIGAPKGVSRLLQRIGRSNHRLDVPSTALLVPASRFEVLEMQAAIAAIESGRLDGEPFRAGSLDVIVQYIINCVCSEPSSSEAIYQQVLTAEPYKHVSRETFGKLFQFAVDGGYVLRSYERYHRLVINEDGLFVPASRMVVSRHRMNIGTIVEAAKLKVKKLNKRGTGRVIGDVEESFAQTLNPGDTFVIGGQLLSFVTVRDMFLEAMPVSGGVPKVPHYAGGNMPLSTFLSEGVRYLLSHENLWHRLPKQVQFILKLQKKVSLIPSENRILVEVFPRKKLYHFVIYSFEGRLAHQTLGMLVTRRMERLKLRPLSFSVTDYALSVTSTKPVKREDIDYIFSREILLDELEEWITESPMLKRSFRKVATITGLTEQRSGGSKKSMKQVTFSTDLIYEVLLKHEPNHILLEVTRDDAERELLDIDRIADLLDHFQDKMQFVELERPSPISISVIFDVRTERVHGGGAEALLSSLKMEAEATEMMEEITQHADDD